MPKQKQQLKLIPKIYQKNFENLGLFFWIEAQKNIIPGITVEQSIIKYCKFVDCEFDTETAMTTYNRLKKEFLTNG